MGWLFTERPKGIKDLDWLNQYFTSTTHWVDCARGSLNKMVLYALCEGPDGNLNIAIGPVQYDRGNGMFGWKDMDESEGPYYYDCPERIMKQLKSPEELYKDSYTIRNAQGWRDKVKESQEALKTWNKIEVGNVVLFDKPFTNETSCLWQVANKKRNIFYSIGIRGDNSSPYAGSQPYKLPPNHYAKRVIEVFDSLDTIPDTTLDFAFL